MNRGRFFLLVLLPAALLVGGLLLTTTPDAADGGWVEAELRDLVLGVEVTGNLQSRDSSFLGPPGVPDIWNFKISFMAPEGEEVRAGEPVLGFDTTELDRRLREMQTESDQAGKLIERKIMELDRSRQEDSLRLAEAEARRHKAAMKVETPEELREAKELAEARLDLELAEHELQHLRSRLESAQRSGQAALEVLRSRKQRADQRVAEIQDSIRRMTVTAPRDGTVIYVVDWSEEKLKVGDQCWRGRKAIELPDLNAMMAKGMVDEADAGQVAVGQPFRIELDAHPDVEFTGKVESIWLTVGRKSWRNPLKVVRMDMTLDSTDTRRMRPGMRFRGTVETERIERTLVIPTDTVFPTPDGPVVYRKTVLGHERLGVVLGKRNDRFIQVLEGLEEGDEVSRRDLGVPERG